MVTQLETTEFEQLTSCLHDLEFMEEAARNLDSTERAELDWLIRKFGMTNLASMSLRRNARIILGKHGTTLHQVSQILFSRLANAGITQPSFAQYISPNGLLLNGDIKHHAAPQIIANTALAKATDIYAYLLELEPLQSISNRDLLETAVTAVLNHCGALRFGMESDMANPLQPDEIKVLFHAALMPQTDLPVELVFQAMNSVGNLLFDTSAILVESAVDRIVHHQAGLACLDLHYADIALKPLITSNKCLKVMSMDEWIVIRPHIELPGAVQGSGFRRLTTAFDEAYRLKNHVRYPKEERDWVELLDNMVRNAEHTFVLWQQQHAALARRYSGESEGIKWLDTKVVEARHKFDTRGSYTSPNDHQSDVPPIAGACPFGY